MIYIIALLLALSGVGCTHQDFKTQKSADSVLVDTTMQADSVTKYQNKDSLKDSLNFDSLYTKSSSEAEKVYFAILKWSDFYKVPKELLFGIAWKETTWLGKNDSNYTLSNRIIQNNNYCHGTMQVIWSTAVNIGKIYDIPVKDVKTLRQDISLNVRLAAALIDYLRKGNNDPYTILVNYNGHPQHKYNYASSVLNYITKTYNVSTGDLKKILNNK